MKRNRLIFLFFVMLCLCSCRETPCQKALQMADSLASANPDSAIVLLRSLKYDVTTAPIECRMYYHLLCIKANDKAYIPHSSDSLIHGILQYYTDKKDMRYLPEAYYYAGRIYRDLGDAPQALDYFDKAMRVLPINSNNPLKSKIYSQIGTLLLYQNIYDEALKIFKEAFKYNMQYNNDLSVVYNLRDMADAYRGNEQLDSALLYYEKAFDLANKLQCPDLLYITQSQIASICVQLEEYNRAKKILGILLNIPNRTNQSAVYSIASRLYYQTGCIDSAVYYYKKLLDCGTIYAKKNANWGLANIALENNNPQDALLYFRQYIECNDSVAKVTNAETIRKMHSLYNYQFREKENKRLKDENDRNNLMITCFWTVCAFLVIAIFAYLQYNRRKRLQLSVRLKEVERLKDEQYRKSIQFIKTNNEKIGELEKKLQDADHINNDLSVRLKKQQERMVCLNKQAEIDMDEHAMMRMNLMKSEISIHLNREVISENYKMDKENWDLLEKTVNEIYEDFTGKLTRIYKLSKYELQVCLLIKINIQPVDIGKFTNHTKASVSSVRRRLYEKFFGGQGEPKMWDEFILSL